MTILQRYQLREILASFVGVTLVLLIILLVYQFGAVLARAAASQLPRAMVGQLFVLGAIENIRIVLPFGLLLGIVLALGRMYHESEITAAQACGYNLRRMYVPVMAVCLPVAALGFWLDYHLAPWAAGQQYELRAAAARQTQAVPLTAGQFRVLDGGRTSVYAEQVDSAGVLHQVFVKRGSGESIETTVAARATQSASADGQTRSIVLFDGIRREGVPGSMKYQMLRFAEQRIPLPPVVAASQRSIATVPSSELRARTDRAAQAQWQWRLATPTMSLLLGIAAVPLARLRPRQGRYAKAWIAVLWFALYADLAAAAVGWVERGSLSIWPGLWLIHGGVALLLLWLLSGRGLLRRLRSAGS